MMNSSELVRDRLIGIESVDSLDIEISKYKTLNYPEKDRKDVRALMRNMKKLHNVKMFVKQKDFVDKVDLHWTVSVYKQIKKNPTKRFNFL